jgi:SAM-dependent methyltransferase
MIGSLFDRFRKTAPLEYELDIPFEDMNAFVAWAQSNRNVLGHDFSTTVYENTLAKGFIEPLTHIKVAPQNVTPDENYREGLGYDGINSRMRAVLLCIEKLQREMPIQWVYDAESVTAMARRLRNAFPCFIGSEYLDFDQRNGAIRHEDLTALSFSDNTFSLVSTNDVLEHVPDIDACLRQIARVLKSGGWHIGTVPFNNHSNSIIRSAIRNGEVVHLMPPEYHGDPVKGDTSSLVYEVPGWNLLDRARKAGFSQATMRLIASTKHGIIATNEPVFVMAFQK